MFDHIKPPLTTAELKEADRLVADGWEPGWIDRRILAQVRGPGSKVQPKPGRGKQVRQLLPGDYD
jgi:hypothetical protein